MWVGQTWSPSSQELGLVEPSHSFEPEKAKKKKKSEKLANTNQIQKLM